MYVFIDANSVYRAGQWQIIRGIKPPDNCGPSIVVYVSHFSIIPSDERGS